MRWLPFFPLLHIHVVLIEAQLTETECKALETSLFQTSLPCECRQNTEAESKIPTPCYPNCCPSSSSDTFFGDRCHEENTDDWSTYEYTICMPKPRAEYLSDAHTCHYKGNEPVIKNVETGSSTTTLSFTLSDAPLLVCHTMYISQCAERRSDNQNQRDFLGRSFCLDKTCWLNCAPDPLAECVSDNECFYHRGRTGGSGVTQWVINKKLPPGSYALVCFTLRQHDAVGSSLFQNQYAQTVFKIA